MIFQKWGGVQRPFRTFPKIHLFWWHHSSLNIQIDVVFSSWGHRTTSDVYLVLQTMIFRGLKWTKIFVTFGKDKWGCWKGCAAFGIYAVNSHIVPLLGCFCSFQWDVVEWFWLGDVIYRLKVISLLMVQPCFYHNRNDSSFFWLPEQELLWLRWGPEKTGFQLNSRHLLPLPLRQKLDKMQHPASMQLCHHSFVRALPFCESSQVMAGIWWSTVIQISSSQRGSGGF